MWRTVLVAFGGMVGSLLRYAVSGWVQMWANSSFPLGTLAVNILGSLLLGFVTTLSLERGWLGADARLFLAVGLCGGFTTMSTFSYETLQLLTGGDGALALLNVAVTLTSCLLAVWLGIVFGRIV